MRIAADTPPLHAALALMRERGGSFARIIADAYTVADKDNRARLRMAFGDLMCNYGAEIWEGTTSPYSGYPETLAARPLAPLLARMQA